MFSAPALDFIQGGDEHAAGAAGGVVDAFARLRGQHLHHEMHHGAVGVELLSGVAAVIGEFLDEELIAVAQLIFRHVGEREVLAGEVLQQVLEGGVGQALFVRPGCIAKDAVEPVRIGRFDDAHGGLDSPAYLARRLPHILPMAARGDDEAVVGHSQGVGFVAVSVPVAGQSLGILLVPHTRQALVEEQGKDELLVVAGVNQTPENGGRTPEVGFEFLLGEASSQSGLHLRPPNVEPVHLTWPDFSGRLRQHGIHCRDEGWQCPVPLVRQYDAAVRRVNLRQPHEIADVEGQDTAPACSGLQQLLLVAGIQGHPLAGRAGHIMSAFQ